MPKSSRKTRGRPSASAPAQSSTSATNRRRATPRRESAESTAAPPAPAPALAVSTDQLRQLVRELIQEALPAVPTPPAEPTDINGGPAAASDQAFATAAVAESPRSDPAASVQLVNDAGMLPHLAGPTTGGPVPVSASLRVRICEHRYVDLSMLLDTPHSPPDDMGPTFQLVQGSLRQVARAPRTIQSFGTWCVAFVRFAQVYLEAHPEDALGIMTHMGQVSQLTAPGLGLAWRQFDEGFRKARETAPGLHKWGQTLTSSHLWLQAVAAGIGGASKGQTGSARQPGTDFFRVCFGFNSLRGCTHRQPCKYAHVCKLCKGRHSATQCAIRANRQRPLGAPSASNPK